MTKRLFIVVDYDLEDDGKWDFVAATKLPYAHIIDIPAEHCQPLQKATDYAIEQITNLHGYCVAGFLDAVFLTPNNDLEPGQ